jgi:hypothetical protein
MHRRPAPDNVQIGVDFSRRKHICCFAYFDTIYQNWQAEGIGPPLDLMV